MIYVLFTVDLYVNIVCGCSSISVIYQSPHLVSNIYTCNTAITKKKQQEKNIRFELCERKPNSFRPKANWIDIFIVSGQTEYL